MVDKLAIAVAALKLIEREPFGSMAKCVTKKAMETWENGSSQALRGSYWYTAKKSKEKTSKAQNRGQPI